MTNTKTKLVGIYARLSKEDSRSGESVSIENQKLLLVKHVKEMGWELIEIYQEKLTLSLIQCGYASASAIYIKTLYKRLPLLLVG